MVVFTLISITSVSMDKRFDIKIADLYRENRYKLFIHASERKLRRYSSTTICHGKK